jgi:hypothetical protein
MKSGLTAQNNRDMGSAPDSGKDDGIDPGIIRLPLPDSFHLNSFKVSLEILPPIFPGLSTDSTLEKLVHQI